MSGWKVTDKEKENDLICGFLDCVNEPFLTLLMNGSGIVIFVLCVTCGFTILTTQYVQ
jgi:hypothetical protein